MPDDWDDRIRSSSAYLNRRDDQIDFTNSQAKIRDATYEGIISGDDFKTRLVLGVVSESANPFDEHLESLVRSLTSSPLPNALKWAERLRAIEREPAALRILHEFAVVYDRFYQAAEADGAVALEIEKDRIVYDVRALWELAGGQ